MREKEIRDLKRLLKELGIYTIWIKNRKKELHGSQSLHFWSLPRFFNNIIDDSFTWSATKEELLWEELYDNTYCDNTPSEILRHNYMVEELKEICKSLL